MATVASVQISPAVGAAGGGRGMELIRRMSPYWDSHMAVPVLDWMLSNNMISSDEHDALKREFQGEAAWNLEKRALIEAEIANIEDQLVNFNHAVAAYKKEQQKRIGGYPERKTILDLSDWWQANSGQTPRPPPLELGVEALIPRLAKLYYDLCDYRKCLQQLQYMLTTLYELTVEGTNVQTRMACYWGVCACMIMLQQNIDFASKEEAEGKGASKDQELLQRLEGAAAVDEDEGEAEAGVAGREKQASTEPHVLAQCILKLGDFLDQAAAAANRKDQDRTAVVGIATTRKQQLLDRSWLLHWAIWPIFGYYSVAVHAKQFVLGNQAWSMLIEWMMSEANLFCVAVVCPHLLRYYAVYAILNRKRKDHFQAVMTALGQSKNRYSDSFTSLLEALFLDFSFDEAQLYIAQVGQECETDFFLHPLKAPINEYSRLLIFETYCRIHKCINVDMIAKKVNMSPEAAERWIVNLIRNARLEARIDSEKNRVQMTAAPPNLYQHVIDKTRNLCIRSNMILQNISRPAGYVREGEDSLASRNARARNRGRQWVQGVGGGEGGGFPRGAGRGRGGRGGRRDPMAAVAASMASRRQDDTAFADTLLAEYRLSSIRNWSQSPVSRKFPRWAGGTRKTSVTVHTGPRFLEGVTVVRTNISLLYIADNDRVSVFSASSVLLAATRYSLKTYA